MLRICSCPRLEGPGQPLEGPGQQATWEHGWEISVRVCLLPSRLIWLSTGRQLWRCSDFSLDWQTRCGKTLSDFWWQSGRKIPDVRCLEDNWMDQRQVWKFVGRIGNFSEEFEKIRYFARIDIFVQNCCSRVTDSGGVSSFSNIWQKILMKWKIKFKN